MSSSENTRPTRADFIRQFLPTSPFVGYLRMQLTEMQPDMAVLTLPFDRSVVTNDNIIHGGAIASLIDVAGMVAAWSDSTVPENARGSTVNMSIAYLAPADNEDIRATARVLRRGRSLAYLDVDVESASGIHVAKGLVTYKLG